VATISLYDSGLWHLTVTELVQPFFDIIIHPLGSFQNALSWLKATPLFSFFFTHVISILASVCSNISHGSYPRAALIAVI